MKRFLLSLLILCALAGCRSESPEARIQKAFDACVEAVEKQDPAAALDHLSSRFSGPEGMSRDEAKLFLMGILRQEKVGVTVFSSRIEVKGTQGSQTAEVLLTSREGSSVLPQDASRRIFLLQWEEEDGQWRLVHMEEAQNG